MQGLSSDFKQFFLVKNIFVYFKKQTSLWNRKAIEKNKLCFDSLSQWESSLSIFLSQHLM